MQKKIIHENFKAVKTYLRQQKRYLYMQIVYLCLYGLQGFKNKGHLEGCLFTFALLMCPAHHRGHS